MSLDLITLFEKGPQIDDKDGNLIKEKVVDHHDNESDEKMKLLPNGAGNNNLEKLFGPPEPSRGIKIVKQASAPPPGGNRFTNQAPSGTRFQKQEVEKASNPKIVTSQKDDSNVGNKNR